jgi:autotransporter family porin
MNPKRGGILGAFRLAVLVGLLSGIASPGSAANKFFRPTELTDTVGDFSGASSWRDAGLGVVTPPTAADDAYITGFVSQTSATVTFSQNVTSANLIVSKPVLFQMGGRRYDLVDRIFQNSGSLLSIQNGTLTAARIVGAANLSITSDAALQLANPSASFFTLSTFNGTGVSVNGNLTHNGTFAVGLDTGIGSLVVSGANATLTSGELSVGADSGDADTIAGTGNVIVQGGATLAAQNAYIGETGNGSATVETGAKVQVTSGLFSGFAGNGTLEIRSGGNVTSGFLSIARVAGTTGNVLVDGPTSSLRTTDSGSGSFRVGRDGNGTLTATGGASVIANQAIEIGFSPGAAGTVLATGANTTVAANGTIAVGGSITTAGGNGLLTVADGAAVTSGNQVIVWAGGRLALANGTVQANSGFRLETGSEITGSGLLHGDVTSNGSTFAPGNSPGTIEITGNLSLVSTDTFVMQLGGTAPGLSDRFIVGGGVLLANATLSLSALPGFTDTPGSEFVLIDNLGTDDIVGEFAGIGEGDVLLLGATQLFASYTGGSGNDFSLSVIPEPSTATALAAGALVFLARRRARRAA